MDRFFGNAVSIYLSVAGAALLLGAMFLLIGRIRLALGQEAQGQVVGYRERIRPRRGAKIQYMPIVRFQPRNGRIQEFQSRMGASERPFQVGEPVQVIYRSDKPQVAEIASGARLWLAPAALAAMSFGLLYGAWKAGAPH